MKNPPNQHLEQFEKSKKIKARIQACIDCTPNGNAVKSLAQKILAEWESES